MRLLKTKNAEKYRTNVVHGIREGSLNNGTYCGKRVYKYTDVIENGDIDGITCGNCLKTLRTPRVTVKVPFEITRYDNGYEIQIQDYKQHFPDDVKLVSWLEEHLPNKNRQQWWKFVKNL